MSKGHGSRRTGGRHDRLAGHHRALCSLHTTKKHETQLNSARPGRSWGAGEPEHTIKLSLSLVNHDSLCKIIYVATFKTTSERVYSSATFFTASATVPATVPATSSWYAQNPGQAVRSPDRLGDLGLYL